MFKACGSSYDGPIVSERSEGTGVYVYPDGTKYEGAFHGGAFHGEGTLKFKDGSSYVGTWSHGKEVSGHLLFNDGLRYESEGWEYCTDKDRRFRDEIKNGILPGQKTQMVGSSKTDLLLDAYDTGDGYFVPSEGVIKDYLTKLNVRIPDSNEIEWIKANCRVGTGF